MCLRKNMKRSNVKQSKQTKNKTRGLLLLLCLLLTLCLLAGCTEKPQGSRSEAELPSDTETSGASSVSEVSGGIPIREEEDFFTAHGVAELPSPSALPEAWKQTDTQHLYRLPLSLPKISMDGGYGYGAEAAGEYLLFSCWENGEKGYLYSLQNGQELCVHTFDGEFLRRLYPDGTILTARDGEDGTVTVYRLLTDGTRETVMSVQADVYSAALSDQGDYLALSEDGKGVRVFDLRTKQQVGSFPFEKPIILTAVGDGFLADDSNGTLTCIRTDDGTTQPIDLPSVMVDTYDGLYSCYQDGGVLLCDGRQDGQNCFLPFDSDVEYLYALSFGWAVTGETGTMHFYDLRNGKRAFSLTLAEEECSASAVFLESGRVLLFSFEDGKSRLLLYDLPAAVSNGYEGRDAKMLFCTQEEVWERLEEIALAVEEETGVELFYGSEGNDFNIYAYVGVAELNPYTNYRVLCRTREILKKYPEGMLREVYSETHEGLRIYLCGTLYGVGEGGLDTAGGVTTTDDDGYILIALDYSNALEHDLPHELSHAFDRRIEYVSGQTGTDWMQIWEQATKVAEPYTETYTGYEYNMEYTWAEERDKENVWFVDSYSRTFPTEDRARIMENLCDPNGVIDDLLQCPHLKEKAELYCRILRECFPSCRSSVPFWELPLQS